MIRKLLVAIAAMAASACSYGSAVDMAPMKSRLASPAVPPGDYCEVQGSVAPFSVISSDDCVPILWDAKTRSYTMSDPEDPEDSIVAATVSLGSNLYLGQVEAETGKPDRYQLQLFIAKGAAFAIVPALGDDKLKQLAAKHSKVTFRNDTTGRLYIASGSSDRIRDFLRAAAKESLFEMRGEGEELSVGIRDTAGVPDHEATRQQVRDIENVLKAAKSLSPK
jgi:hypothetical protein